MTFSLILLKTVIFYSIIIILLIQIFFQGFHFRKTDVKFPKSKTLPKWQKHSAIYTGVGKLCLSGEFLTLQICILMRFARIFEFT